MPFAVKDVLQHKRTNRQIREIHQRQYEEYLIELRKQQPLPNQISSYHLSEKHYKEIERCRQRFAATKRIEYSKISEQNQLIADRLSKASQRTLVDSRNSIFDRDLTIFSEKLSQQRFNQYKKIEEQNNVLFDRLRTTQSKLFTKQQCDKDWQKHIISMKKTCQYPENIDRFVSNTKAQRRKSLCPLMKLHSGSNQD